MTSIKKDTETLIPDLRDILLSRFAQSGSSALAHSITLYTERPRETASGVPVAPHRVCDSLAPINLEA
jgi:hypothetical protein